MLLENGMLHQVMTIIHPKIQVPNLEVLGTVPYKAVYRVGIPFDKPYPYSLYR